MSLFLFSPTLNAINQKRWVALGWPKGFVGRWSRRSEDRSYPMNNFPKKVVNQAGQATSSRPRKQLSKRTFNGEN
ncbi:uncharacterized protein LOC129313090 isoform X3 [Prosopis cineraria]|uniref:uncharacterized protein LOC129313090 isoform X3 n=1 Tax=Prosopis cineraria TaxID=364024 RepID=UPI00240F1DC3|nr:uncharacterized protein LOC129313090 isoform X3 [Prosopis cineraria]